MGVAVGGLGVFVGGIGVAVGGLGVFVGVKLAQKAQHHSPVAVLQVFTHLASARWQVYPALGVILALH